LLYLSSFHTMSKYNHFVHEPFDVTDGSEVYTKEQLLEKLREVCPDELASFPAPDAFEIREHHRGKYAVKVGYAVTKKSRKVGDMLWVDERKRKDVPDYSEFTWTQQAYYRTERAFKIRRREVGLYYTTSDDSARNRYVRNAKVIKGDNVFGKLAESGIITPFSLMIKALLRFNLLYCDRTTEYRTFENDNVKSKAGLAPLVRALRAIARNTSDDEDGDASTTEDVDGAIDASDHEGDLFVADANDKASAKRKDTMDAEVDEGAPAKKIRAC